MFRHQIIPSVDRIQQLRSGRGQWWAGRTVQNCTEVLSRACDSPIFNRSYYFTSHIQLYTCLAEFFKCTFMFWATFEIFSYKVLIGHEWYVDMFFISWKARCITVNSAFGFPQHCFRFCQIARTVKRHFRCNCSSKSWIVKGPFGETVDQQCYHHCFLGTSVNPAQCCGTSYSISQFCIRSDLSLWAICICMYYRSFLVSSLYLHVLYKL